MELQPLIQRLLGSRISRSSLSVYPYLTSAKIRVLYISFLFHKRHGNESLLEKLRRVDRSMASNKDWWHNTVSDTTSIHFGNPDNYTETVQHMVSLFLC